MRLSVIVITLNEVDNVDNIERCINSVRGIADEIIVLDKYPGDNKTGVTPFSGVKVIPHNFTDYTSLRNFATTLAKNDWILSIDASESLSEELRLNIRVVKTTMEYSCYQFNRLTNYRGKWIRYGGWYPDKKIRLFDKTKGKWRARAAQELWKPYSAKTKVGSLDGDLLHYMTEEELHNNNELNAKKTAIKNYETGKRITLLKTLTAPVLRFLDDYVIKLGFLDGLNGYHACKMTAYAIYLKCKKTRVLFHQNVGREIRHKDE